MVPSKLLFGFAALALVSVASSTGCAVVTDPTDEGAVEESSDELNAAGKALIGSYQDDSGAFKSLVLTSKTVGPRNEFFADVDTGINCITTPCPSSEHIEGTFTAGSKTITLYSTTTVYAKHLLGKFNYLVQGNKLSLSRKGFAQSLEKVNTEGGANPSLDGGAEPSPLGPPLDWSTAQYKNLTSFQIGPSADEIKSDIVVPTSADAGDVQVMLDVFAQPGAAVDLLITLSHANVTRTLHVNTHGASVRETITASFGGIDRKGLWRLAITNVTPTAWYTVVASVNGWGLKFGQSGGGGGSDSCSGAPAYIRNACAEDRQSGRDVSCCNSQGGWWCAPRGDCN